jgi:glycosyltransferase involved in cell wall biosynthesis
MTALSVVFPCYNEAERLPATLQAYLAHLPRAAGEVEVLVVDDGSTDGTLVVAAAVAAGDPRLRLIRTGPNRGKGFAVRTGMLAAQGDRVVFTDADGAYAPGEADRVAGALADTPVAIGTRDPHENSDGVARRVASQACGLAVRGLLGLPFRDTQCGLKGFRRDAAQAVFSRARMDGSRSTSRRWCWPDGSAWRWPRSRSAPSGERAARSGCSPTGSACWRRSGRSAGRRPRRPATPHPPA